MSLDRKSTPGGLTNRKRMTTSRPRPKAATSDLADGEARYRILADQTRDGIFLADGGTSRLVDVNIGASDLTGYPRAELIGAPISKLVAREDRGAQRKRFSATPTQVSLASQARILRKDGSPIEVDIERRRLADGRVLAVVRAADRGGLVGKQYNQMLARFDLLVATVDRGARISYANAALSALTGWSIAELIGRPAGELLPIGSPNGQNLPLSDEFWAGNLDGLITTEILTRSGEKRLVAVSATALRDQYGTSAGAALLGQDITQGRAALTELERELQERAGVAAAIARLQPGGTTEAKARAICQELRGLRGVDLAAVLAFTEDGETRVLASDAPADIRKQVATSPPAARSAYLKERAAKGPWVELWKPRVGDGAYGVPLARAGLHSVSYAPIRQGNDTLGLLQVGSLHRGADDRIHDNLPAIAEFGSAASALLAGELLADRLVNGLRGRLHEIVRSGTFSPVFQPIVEVDTGQVVGYEALSRFTDGEPPDNRFSSAWSVGLGAELELATLDRAIRESRDLPTGPWLNVNISPRLLDHGAELRAILDQAHRPLVLEITEHELISDYRALKEALGLLMPIRIAVDDAGAGIANFTHIVDLQPDFVKLDIGLVRGVDTDLARQAMIVALGHFARTMGCQLVAEGVETEAEARMVKSLGVAFGQGYWYGHPLPMDAIIATPGATHGAAFAEKASPSGSPYGHGNGRVTGPRGRSEGTRAESI